MVGRISEDVSWGGWKGVEGWEEGVIKDWRKGGEDW